MVVDTWQIPTMKLICTPVVRKRQSDQGKSAWLLSSSLFFGRCVMRRNRVGWSPRLWGSVAVIVGSSAVVPLHGAAPPAPPGSPQAIVEGRELFNRQWLPQDERAHGGDGLG